MGQKVNPHGLRVGVIKDWDSRWYAEADFADNLVEDHKIRTFLKKKLYSAGVSKIEIERASDKVKIILYTAKPGVVIGKGGSEIEKVKADAELSEEDFKDGQVDILTIVHKAGLAASRSEARRNVQQGGVTVDGEKVTDIAAAYTREQLQTGLLVKRGKKNFRKIIVK